MYFNMLKMNVVFTLFSLAVFVSSVSCISENDQEAIRNTLDPLITKCLDQCGLKQIELEDGDFDPCLKKCFVKTLNVLDDKDQLDRDVLHSMFREYIEDKEESMKKQKIFEDCFDDNNSDVTDDGDAEVNVST